MQQDSVHESRMLITVKSGILYRHIIVYFSILFLGIPVARCASSNWHQAAVIGEWVTPLFQPSHYFLSPGSASSLGTTPPFNDFSSRVSLTPISGGINLL